MAAFLSAVELAELLDGFGGNQRSVSGKHDNLVKAIARERFPRRHERVSRASLLGLQYKVHARAGHRLAHALRFMADDYEDILRGHDLCGRGNHMCQDRFASNFMQHLGMFRLQPRAFARRHNRDGDTRGLRMGRF